jgi:pimeloyl-ACP methyl ester carboxylesterase
MKRLPLNEHLVAYEDTGEGPPVVLAHCSSASHREWSSLTRALQGRYRVLAPDLIGYGESKDYPLDDDFDPLADANVLLQLLEIASEPVHLVGHSYGAAMALEAARLAAGSVRSLTLVEPVSFHLLKLGGRDGEWREIEVLGERIMDRVGAGDAKGAAGAFMVFWIGRPRWWLMPKKAKLEIIATIGKVAKEFCVLNQAEQSLADYQNVSVPTLLVVGSRTRKPARAVIEVLESVMPQAKLTTLAGAGHMSPFTHKEEINLLVQEHIAANDDRSDRGFSRDRV